MEELDKKIILEIQKDFPIEEFPFEKIARNLQITDEEVVFRLNQMKEKGFIRKFGAVLNHRKVGYQSNAMVVWDVQEDRLQEVGEYMAQQKEVSHCYVRKRYLEWPYNLYTMLHAQSKAACDELIDKLATYTNISNFEVLYSTKELKKKSYQFFDLKI